MNQPRVTVITPNYNNGQFLERTICSVLDQGYENLEYFVIDGGSSDESVDILRLYENELAGWVSEPDDGPADAINKALQRATGDIIAFVDSDDLYMPGTLGDVAQRMTQPDAPCWVVGHYQWTDPDDQFIGLHTAAAPRSLGEYLMHDSGDLPTSACFWSKSLFDAHGPLDGQMRWAYGYEFASRLISKGYSPTVLPQPLTAKRKHDNSRGATETLGHGMEYLTAARRYAGHLPLTQRYALWSNCDKRRRIYALAQAETLGSSSRRFLLQKVLLRPWWIANDTVRHTLLRGVDHPLPAPDAIRHAA